MQAVADQATGPSASRRTGSSRASSPRRCTGNSGQMPTGPGGGVAEVERRWLETAGPDGGKAEVLLRPTVEGVRTQRRGGRSGGEREPEGRELGRRPREGRETGVRDGGDKEEVRLSALILL